MLDKDDEVLADLIRMVAAASEANYAALVLAWSTRAGSGHDDSRIEEMIGGTGAMIEEFKVRYRAYTEGEA